MYCHTRSRWLRHGNGTEAERLLRLSLDYGKRTSDIGATVEAEVRSSIGVAMSQTT
jgi:hypothetical protein